MGLQDEVEKFERKALGIKRRHRVRSHSRRKVTKTEMLKTANRILKKGYMIKWSKKKGNWVRGKKKYL